MSTSGLRLVAGSGVGVGNSVGTGTGVDVGWGVGGMEGRAVGEGVSVGSGSPLQATRMATARNSVAVKMNILFNLNPLDQVADDFRASLHSLNRTIFWNGAMREVIIENDMLRVRSKLERYSEKARRPADVASTQVRGLASTNSLVVATYPASSNLRK